MVVNKRKKNSRHRGSWTHGWGEKKKHRGAGSRGGRGNAGSGKRADTNNPTYQKIPGYFGKSGFNRPNAEARVLAINVSTLESNLSSLVASGAATKKGSSYVVDLTKTQYGKLLGSGSISTAVEVTVDKASASAVEKISAAKGKVTVLEASESKSDE
jgi:large subunit ribosomal protein L15